MRKWISGVSVLVAMLALQSTTPAHASGVQTYTTMHTSFADGKLYIAVALNSSDRRCTYGRTVRLQEKIDGSFKTVATDVPKATSVAGFRYSLTANKLRAQVPAKTLSDGTRCAAAKPAPFVPTRMPGVTGDAAARGIAEIGPDVAGLSSWNTLYMAGDITGVSAECRRGRVVKYQFDTGSGWVTLSKDVTGKNGVYGLGGEFPNEPLRVLVPQKAVGGGSCSAISLGLSF